MLIQLFLGGPGQIKHESEQNTKVNKTFISSKNAKGQTYSCTSFLAFTSWPVVLTRKNSRGMKYVIPHLVLYMNSFQSLKIFSNRWLSLKA